MHFIQKYITFLFLGLFLIAPQYGFAANDQAGSAPDSKEIQNPPKNSLLSPDFWFDALKKNITLPIPLSSTTEVQIPSPEKTLKDASPKLQEVNSQVRNEVGIDFGKFIGWSAKVLTLIFQIMINLLQTVSSSLSGNK